jgi:hypothetical protein
MGQVAPRAVMPPWRIVRSGSHRIFGFTRGPTASGAQQAYQVKIAASLV